MKLIFLHADKHENLLQIDTHQNRILMGVVKHTQSSQNSKFGMFLQYPPKKLGIMLIFYMQINIKVSYVFISTLWASKFPISDTVINHEHNHKYSQKTQSKMFAISLQYLKKKLEMDFIFCM